ncbi:MAG: hypothetical protein NPIRA04_29020 [Nitrospirales bacterium]|nr:MAG: hypothetical protein NPIRA04_29020 [Nitrospirales bacterium]
MADMRPTPLIIMLCISMSFLTDQAGSLRDEAVGQTRTETNCNIGMLKDQTSSRCQIPIPSDCTVVKRPGFNQPWADISKGGTINCRFEEQETDWETTIVGTCDTCTSDQCSARFSVMLKCVSPQPPPTMQQRAH